MNSGYLLINKPSASANWQGKGRPGPTSHDIVDLARQKLGVRKIGHCGTLDPFASGLLILLVGREATKQQARFMKQDKEYLATALWGYTSDTYDITGEMKKIAEEEKQAILKQVQDDVIKAALKKFQGKIVQTVPAYSAVKVGGKKLYEMARARRGDPLWSPKTKRGRYRLGQVQVLPLPQRQVEIHKFELTDEVPPDNPEWSNMKAKLSKKSLAFNHFRIFCSSGTYVRSLIHDLGQELGCGAVCAALQRTKIGDFKIDQAINPDEICTEKIIEITKN